MLEVSRIKKEDGEKDNTNIYLKWHETSPKTGWYPSTTSSAWALAMVSPDGITWALPLGVSSSMLPSLAFTLPLFHYSKATMTRASNLLWLFTHMDIRLSAVRISASIANPALTVSSSLGNWDSLLTEANEWIWNKRCQSIRSLLPWAMVLPSVKKQAYSVWCRGVLYDRQYLPHRLAIQNYQQPRRIYATDPLMGRAGDGAFRVCFCSPGRPLHHLLRPEARLPAKSREKDHRIHSLQ